MNTGKFAAYKQVTTPNSDLSGVIAQQEQLQNRFQEKKDLKAEKQKNEQKARTEDIDRINAGAKTKYLNFEHSLQDAFRRKGGFIERYSNASARYEKDPSDTEAYGIMQNINQEVKRVALTKKTILGYDKLLSEGIANGTIDADMNKDFVAQLEKLKSGQINFDVDEYGNMKIKNLAGLDFDNNGIADEITLESLSNQSNFGYFKDKFDLNASNVKMKKRFGTKSEKVQNPNGLTGDTLKTKGYDSNNSLLVEDEYKSMFGKDVNSLTSDGKSQLYQEGIDPEKIKEKQYKDFLDSKVKGFQAMYNSEREENSAEIQRERLKIARLNSEKEAPKKQYNIQVLTAEGKILRSNNVNGDKQVDFGLNSLKIRLDDKDVEITQLGITDKGEVSYTATDLALEKRVNTKKSKSNMKLKEYENSTIMSASIRDLGIIAIKLGFRNYDELKSHLDEKKNEIINSEKEKEPEPGETKETKGNASRFNPTT